MAGFVAAVGRLQQAIQKMQSQGMATSPLGQAVGAYQAGVKAQMASLAELTTQQKYQAAASSHLTEASNTTGNALSSLAPLAAGLGGIIIAAVRGLSAIASTARGLAEIASPSAESTLQGNLNILSAIIGERLVPYMLQLAKVVYITGQLLDRLPLKRLFDVDPVAQTWEKLLGGLANAAGIDLKKMPTDLVTPVRSSVTSDATAFADRLQTAALDSDVNQTKIDLLKKHLEVLLDSKKLLETLNEKQPTRQAPPWLP